MRRRQKIDYTAAMGTNTNKYKSPHNKNIDECKRSKIWLTEEMSLSELHNEIHSMLGDLFNSGAMAAKFLLNRLPQEKEKHETLRNVKNIKHISCGELIPAQKSRD